MSRYARLGSACWLLMTVSGASAQSGRILGQLINRTPHGDIPANSEVILMEFTSQQTKGHRSARTDASGRFVFDDVNVRSHRTCIVGALYKRGEYSSGVLTFSGKPETKRVTIPVYEPTTDPSAIRVQMHHMILRQKDNRLGAMEILVLQNTGDKTLIGNIEIAGKPHKATLFVSLPPKATEFSPGEGSSDLVAATEGGFAYFADIPPGEPAQLTYTYDLSSLKLPGDLSRQISYPTKHFALLTDPAQLNLASKVLRDRSSKEMGGQQFLTLSADDLPVGRLSVTVLPAGRLARKLILNRLLWILVPIGVFFLAWRGASVLVRKNAPRVEKEPSLPGKTKTREKGRVPATVEQLNQQRDQLVDEIARLDDQFESNEIPPEQYESLRAARKRELEVVMERLSVS